MQIPHSISLDKEGQYCIRCFSRPVERVIKNNLTYYKCIACGKISERSLVIDNRIMWWVDKERTYWHESVGVFVWNNEETALFFERTIYPFALTIPAGHLDKSEYPEKAAKRELQEETGIVVDTIKLFSEEDIIGDECRRGSDHHRWHLYTARVGEMDEIKINEEGMKPIWATLEEVKRKELIYPVKYFIEKYGSNLLN